MKFESFRFRVADMDGHSSFGPVTVLLLAALTSSALGQSPLYFEEGTPLVLKPPKHKDVIKSVVWTSNTSLVVEWLDNKQEFYRSFKGRTELNQSTAQLTVNNVRQSDGGEYKVEINLQQQSQVYEVKVIKKVTKPSVKGRTLTCGPTSSSCTFTCQGDTAGTQPLTYSWRKDSGEWGPEQQSMDLTIYNNNETKLVEQIWCRMKNPINEKESDPLANPMYLEDLGSLSSGAVAGIIISFLVILGVLVGLVYWLREDIMKKIRACLGTGSSRPAEPSTEAEKDESSVNQPLNEIQGHQTASL